ncbi:rhodanese-like domain-containing protein [Colwellia sp. D2M02]|uniref:rhodanese-like domain-containing protein n=1 Tax=Colwellia sp. D2M02 TaxID=2841562 RepID=UPI001C088C16|nr:rhodanese-like domain-containing protein [Colwellia sp. D2M02]MBU2894524.1 rhodanese-like domain-containing protein [Colwellia sp. D2M02]
MINLKKTLMIIMLPVFFLLAHSTSLAVEVSQKQLLSLMEQADKPLLLDVRSAEEYAQGHIPGAINIPHTEINSRLNELLAYQHQQIVLYCRSGRRVDIATTALLKQGFSQLDHLTGDFNGWQSSDLPQVKRSVK